jgi:methionyl-tRNA formyltransferase
MRVIIREVKVCAASDPDGVPGAAIAADDGIQIRCGDGSLSIQRLQPAGKREMDSDEFCRGYGSELLFGKE